MMDSSTGDFLSIDHQTLRSLHQSGNHDEVKKRFLAVFEQLSSFSYTRFSTKLQESINSFFEIFFEIFLDEKFILSPQEGLTFINHNALISNLLALSRHQNSDAQLTALLEQQENLYRFLTLYSARNSVEINPIVFFKANLDLASYWYFKFFDLYRSALPCRDVGKKLLQHMQYYRRDIRPIAPVARAYYGSSYLGQRVEKQFKESVNKTIQSLFAWTRLTQLQPAKIGVVSAVWRKSHAVYKNQSAFIEALQEKFETVLVCLSDRCDSDGFSSSIYLDPSQALQPERIAELGCELLYYPDIGMSEHSIWYANARLAPIQVCGFGHSVSTFGSKIDYVVTGADVEDLRLCRENYSERPLVLPGPGIVHDRPEAPAPQEFFSAEDRVVIACPWAGHKCNPEILGCLDAIAQKTELPVHYRLFVNRAIIRFQGLLPFCQDIAQHLNHATVEIIPGLPYEEYLSALAQSHFCLDAFHYGGVNSVIDALYIGKPIITWEGSTWYNRMGSAQLRVLGLDALIATNRESYIAKAVQLAVDTDFREQQIAAVKDCGLLKSVLFDRSEARHFRKAIEYVLQNHKELVAQGSREPILI